MKCKACEKTQFKYIVVFLNCMYCIYSIKRQSSSKLKESEKMGIFSDITKGISIVLKPQLKVKFLAKYKILSK